MTGDVLLDCRRWEPPSLPAFKTERGQYVALRPLSEEDIISTAKALLGLRVELEVDSQEEPADDVPPPEEPSTETLEDWLKLYFAPLEDEHLLVAYLDAGYRLATVELHSRGGLHETAISPRRLLRRIMDLNAGAVILAHNHPGGNPTPSHEDKRGSRDLEVLLGVLGVRLAAHHIFGSGELRTLRPADWTEDKELLQIRQSAEQISGGATRR